MKNSNLIGGLKYDLTQCSDNLVVAYFFGPPCMGVPKIFQWREFTAVDPGIFQKGAEPGSLQGEPRGIARYERSGDKLTPVAEAKCEISVQFLTLSSRKFRISRVQ